MDIPTDNEKKQAKTILAARSFENTLKNTKTGEGSIDLTRSAEE